VADLSAYTRVVEAQDLPACPCCGEPFCPRHKKHYGECDCIGPTEDDVDYITVADVLYGRRIPEPGV
jgi:hypothetical protein